MNLNVKWITLPKKRWKLAEVIINKSLHVKNLDLGIRPVWLTQVTSTCLSGTGMQDPQLAWYVAAKLLTLCWVSMMNLLVLLSHIPAQVDSHCWFLAWNPTRILLASPRGDHTLNHWGHEGGRWICKSVFLRVSRELCEWRLSLPLRITWLLPALTLLFAFGSEPGYTLEGHGNEVKAVAWAPSGKHLANYNQDKNVSQGIWWREWVWTCECPQLPYSECPECGLEPKPGVLGFYQLKWHSEPAPGSRRWQGMLCHPRKPQSHLVEHYLCLQ